MIDFKGHLSSYVRQAAQYLRQPSGYSVGIISRENGGSGRYAIS